MIKTVDYHTAGEPFRIVADPPIDIAGSTVADRRAYAIGSAEVDGLRRLLCFEPRGHADMYGGFLVPPDDDGADLGVLFWHKDGFSTACGHGTMALGVWAVESGLIRPAEAGPTEVVIDVPSGRVRASVHTDAEGAVTAVDFVNVPSRLVASGVTVETSRGPVEVDLAWGGALYACVEDSGIDVTPDRLGELIAFGREVKAGLRGHPLTVHPDDERLSGVYGTIVVDRLGTTSAGELHQRNVTIFADGQVDRSPCGSGTAARVAALHATGELGDGQRLVHESIVGTRFTARVLDVTDDGVVPVVTGTAHQVAESSFTVDPKDDLVPGFVLR
ncbi:proline racemase family protein [Brevibacterium casei]|uniref:Proline racemase n=1 Tax=Brevibacterium casei CIP 102111 TaxID=1255625 RepID=A0A2H1HJY9_9MICO|nr:proline racemase family protein [Brevibacterium casei]MCT1765257.1 proline racemase family protein [Brevibacterium casei]QPR38768.1 proline racemase family protein [Brevibacterium casei]QPR42933.1 proline racemase family protein [Brevibacterium casei]SMX63214.1 proline racemase [Brevibacterium casei CIP 102111]